MKGLDWRGGRLTDVGALAVKEHVHHVLDMVLFVAFCKRDESSAGTYLVIKAGLQRPISLQRWLLKKDC